MHIPFVSQSFPFDLHFAYNTVRIVSVRPLFGSPVFNPWHINTASSILSKSLEPSISFQLTISLRTCTVLAVQWWPTRSGLMLCWGSRLLGSFLTHNFTCSPFDLSVRATLPTFKHCSPMMKPSPRVQSILVPVSHFAILLPLSQV